MTIPALIMLGPPGLSEIEYLVSDARRHAALDLVQRLQSSHVFEPVYVFTPDQNFVEPLRSAGATIILDIEKTTFHFGNRLRSCIEKIAVSAECLAYFGAASAPLLEFHFVEEILRQGMSSEAPWACVNNFHSSDWAVFNHPHLIAAAEQHLPTDNSLGWVARNMCGYEVHSLSPCAASRADLDTPSDILMLEAHPSLGPNLQEWISESFIYDRTKINTLRLLLATPAATLAMIGRISSVASQSLEKNTQIWTRVFAEERGMSASGRLERGEVNSLVGRIFAAWGPERFIQEMEALAGAVLWDTRVVMAQLYGWPSAHERFSFDVGRCDLLGNKELEPWCQALHESAAPIISGGHNVVSGGLLALIETVYPESRMEVKIL